MPCLYSKKYAKKISFMREILIKFFKAVFYEKVEVKIYGYGGSLRKNQRPL